MGPKKDPSRPLPVQMTMATKVPQLEAKNKVAGCEGSVKLQ